MIKEKRRHRFTDAAETKGAKDLFKQFQFQLVPYNGETSPQGFTSRGDSRSSLKRHSLFFLATA